MRAKRPLFFCLERLDGPLASRFIRAWASRAGHDHLSREGDWLYGLARLSPPLTARLAQLGITVPPPPS